MSFLIAAILAGCTTSPTFTPKVTPTPISNPENTSTPTSGEKWKAYSDPFGRYSISYPENWFINSPDVEVDSITIITILPNEPSQSVSKQSTELEFDSSEFFIVINFDPNIRLANNTELIDWVKENDPGRGKIISINEATVNEYQAVEKIVQVTPDNVYRAIYFTTQSGLIQIIAENINSPDATYLADILLTLKITPK